MEVTENASGRFDLCLVSNRPYSRTSVLIPYAESSNPLPRILPLDFECLAVFVLPPHYGDANADGELDLDDHATFVNCLNGPDVEPRPTPLDCLKTFDIDADRDIDLADFATFQLALTQGP